MLNDIIYFAGFIDADGTIGIGRHLTTVGNYSYHQKIQVTSTNVHMVNWIVKKFGGKFPKPVEDKREVCKDTYHWYLTGRKSYRLIKDIFPYLIIKQEQSDCAIELYEKVSKFKYGSTNPIPLYKRKQAENLFYKCRELNKKGKESIEEHIEIETKLVRRKTITLEEFV